SAFPVQSGHTQSSVASHVPFGAVQPRQRQLAASGIVQVVPGWLFTSMQTTPPTDVVEFVVVVVVDAVVPIVVVVPPPPTPAEVVVVVVALPPSPSSSLSFFFSSSAQAKARVEARTAKMPKRSTRVFEVRMGCLL